MKKSTKAERLRARQRYAAGLLLFCACSAIILSLLASTILPASGTSSGGSAQITAPPTPTPTPIPSLRTDTNSAHWSLDANGWRFTDAGGVHPSSRWLIIDGAEYYFDENGYIATGWVRTDGSLYLLNGLGQRVTHCWVNDPEMHTLYLDDAGSAVRGWFTNEEGKTYYFTEEGFLLTGWQTIDGNRYYLLPDGARTYSWQTIDDGVYYFDPASGIMCTGWMTIDNNNYYFGSDGKRATGIVEVDGVTQYFDENGIVQRGLVTMNNYIYFINESGMVTSNWVETDGHSYYFGEDGKAYTGGWHLIDGGYYYFDGLGIYDSSKVYDVTTAPKVALTFDDGPGVYTNDLLDLLAQYNSKATFFMIGEQVNDFAEAVRREYQMGMEQGNHTWDHTTLTHLDAAGIADEVGRTNEVIYNVTGANPTLFRPPGGGYNDLVMQNSYNMPMIMWSIDTLDWDHKNAQISYDTVMSQVKDGDIILMHEIYQSSLDAARMLVPALIEQGYQLVTVSELAASKGVTLHSGYSYGVITGNEP